MTNYCVDCGDTLICESEWRRGQCLYCQMVDLEKKDREYWEDQWFDEGGR